MSSPLNNTEKLVQTMSLINGIMGALAAIPNLLLLVTLIHIQYQRRGYTLLILLTVGDSLGCLGLTYMGFMRYHMINVAMEQRMLPVRTAWTCSMFGFDYIRVSSNVMTPLAQIAIAVDRFICIVFPTKYRRNVSNRQLCFAAGVVLSTVVVLLVACILSYSRRNNGPVALLCGREASFGKQFTNLVCLWIVVGYMVAFLICLSAYGVLAKRKKSTSKQNLHKIRLIMVISFLSFILLFIPNITFLLDKSLFKFRSAVKMATFIPATIAFSLNFVVFMALSRVFRQHILQILFCKSSKVVSVLDTMSRKPNEKKVYQCTTIQEHSRGMHLTERDSRRALPFTMVM